MKEIAITGATGFLSQALIPYLYKEYNPDCIRLLGRSEWKLAQLLRTFSDFHEILRPLIVDIRDRERVKTMLDGVDLVIHTAALKRLEICNGNPQEAIKTNIIGSMNVMDACIQLKIPNAIFISSDKAVNATNLYGRTKAVVESMVQQRAMMLGDKPPMMKIVRYGNVIPSTGAVIPYWIELAKNRQELPITDPRMTRFLITKKVALETIKRAIECNEQAKIIIPEHLMSMGVLEMAETINEHFVNVPDKIKIIGMFDGEKLHEEIEPGVTSENTNVSRYEFIQMLKEDGLL